MLKQMAEVTVLHHKSMETRTKIAKVIFLLTTCQVQQQKYLEEESHFKKKGFSSLHLMLFSELLLVCCICLTIWVLAMLR